jgi:hypothetical protein
MCHKFLKPLDLLKKIVNVKTGLVEWLKLQECLQA